MLAPDVGTIVEVDDPTQFCDFGGLTKGKRTYRVNSWLKAAPEPKHDIDTPEGMDAFIEYVLTGKTDGLGEIVDQSAMRFVQFGNVRLMSCIREEAEYLSCSGVGGAILAISEVRVVGRVSWSEETIDELRASALRGIGRMVG